MAIYDCMPRGLVDQTPFQNGVTCPTAQSLLTSLGIFNLEFAVLSLILGHESVRRVVKKIFTFHPGNTWSPWGALSVVLLHILAMVAATLASRTNGFRPDFEMLFGFWTMRPRAAIATAVWHVASLRFSRRKPYLWTLKDIVLEESLLNILSLGFAIQYAVWRPIADEYSGFCVDDPSYKYFWNLFYVIVAAGGISAVLLVAQTIHWLKNRHTSKYQDLNHEKDTGVFWKWVLWIATLNMMATCVGSWLIWSTFINDAVPDFCPGSLTGQGLAWGVTLFLNALARPIIGGAPDS